MLLGDLVTAELSVPEEARALDVRGLTADSRVVQPGFLFAALAGTRTDGARFAADAVARGAVAVLADDAAQLDVSVPVLRSVDPRRALALIAARLYPRQPEHLVAVTGTSGKTSVADFTRQIFAAAGLRAASVGTLGVVTDAGTDYGTHTTPDPVSFHATLDRLAGEGITHAVIEASSQGLDQRRVDGVRLQSAAFTNLGRDHMDYHSTVDEYLAAKLRLFQVVLPAGGTAVIDMDDARSAEVLAVAEARGARVVRTGSAGVELRLVSITPQAFRQHLTLEAFGENVEVALPLAGAFQASNALVAAGLAISSGVPADVALRALEGLKGAPGRLELAGRKTNGAMVFVDYAHKPEALASVLQSLRPMTRGRLVVVFGAGGDRDAGKRPLMGAAAARHADVVIVTDDNPRSEDPASIRKAVLAAAPGALEIGDRAEAIAHGVAVLEEGDVLVVAGKGHETGQIVGTSVLHFSDHESVRDALGSKAAE